MIPRAATAALTAMALIGLWLAPASARQLAVGAAAAHRGGGELAARARYRSRAISPLPVRHRRFAARVSLPAFWCAVAALKSAAGCGAMA